MRVVTDKCLIFLLMLSVAIALPLLPAHAADSDALPEGASDASDTASGQSLILNVFLDSAGKALVTGYAESAEGLDFLNNSDFRLENDTHRLYALTDGLTEKSGDLWTLNFNAQGSFDDYRVTFYLPKETRLGEINASRGLGYLLSASNESIVADLQGYDLSNPQIAIHYRQPLEAGKSSLLPPVPPPGFLPDGSGLILIIVAAALIVVGFAAAMFVLRARGARGGSRPAETSQPSSGQAPSGAGGSDELDEDGDNGPDGEVDGGRDSDLSGKEAAQAPQELEGSQVGGNQGGQVASGLIEVEPLGETDGESEGESEGGSEVATDGGPEFESESMPKSPSSPSGSAGGVITVSSEMAAVMQTLTARERAVMSTLIDHGGRMTQAEIRYQTATPKSSLTGILISLERRKLVTKKEWGRTNIIELSEWFLSRKEQS